MKGRLNIEKNEYVFFHLNNIADLSPVKQNFKFHIDDTNKSKIIFSQSSDEFSYEKVFYINKIPILFPLSNEKNWYTLDKNNNLIFKHDILKSAFYLLSGYQELDSSNLDAIGRFNYKNSIQHKLGIIKKPVVNYYFEIIIQGLKEYCEVHNIYFQQKKLFSPFAFMLTHDVDRLDQYHFWEVALKIQEFLGIKPNPYSSRKTLNKVTLDYILSFLHLKKSLNNDFWSFDFLMNIEKKNNINAVYFFLDKEGLHQNSRYNFHEPRVIRLINELNENNHEIGLHGTIQSVNNPDYMSKALSNLQKISPQKIKGNRQHYLKFIYPKTFNILEQVGITYDSSLGFAQHEGFRNSYCLPFKPYDFDNERTINVWEIPLIAMDTTLTSYRKMTSLNIKNTVTDLVNEIKKFGGVFTLLWHNCHFDENKYSGIYKIYTDLIELITSSNPQNITGKEIINRIKT